MTLSKVPKWVQKSKIFKILAFPSIGACETYFSGLVWGGKTPETGIPAPARHIKIRWEVKNRPFDQVHDDTENLKVFKKSPMSDVGPGLKHFSGVQWGGKKLDAGNPWSS